MMLEEFEKLPGGWCVTAEEFEQVIDPCYMYLPEELVGVTQRSFSDWLVANGITHTEELRRTWMPVAREMRNDFELMKADKDAIVRLENMLQEKETAKEALHRDIEALLEERLQLQNEVAGLTEAVDELSMYVSDDQIVRMVEDIGRTKFFKWYTRRSME